MLHWGTLGQSAGSRQIAKASCLEGLPLIKTPCCSLQTTEGGSISTDVEVFHDIRNGLKQFCQAK